MPLTDEDLKQVGGYVQAHLIEWLPRNLLEVNEKLVRLDERLEKQQELMKQGFEQMDKRFEQVDKRFEDLRTDMNARFEEQRVDMNARFGDMHRHTTRWSTAVIVVVGVAGLALTAASIFG